MGPFLNKTLTPDFQNADDKSWAPLRSYAHGRLMSLTPACRKEQRSMWYCIPNNSGMADDTDLRMKQLKSVSNRPRALAHTSLDGCNNVSGDDAAKEEK